MIQNKDTEYVTKTDLEMQLNVLRHQIKADLAELESRLSRLMLTTVIALTAIFGGLVTILKLFG